MIMLQKKYINKRNRAHIALTSCKIKLHHTYKCTKHCSIANQERIAVAERRESSSHTTDEQGGVVEHQAVHPRFVRHPTEHHPTNRVGYPNDRYQECGICLVYSILVSPIWEVDIWHVEPNACTNVRNGEKKKNDVF